MSLPFDLDDKLANLKEELASLEPGLIAVSGGVDSRLLAHLAWSWNFDFEAVHFTGPHVPTWESLAAVTWLIEQKRTFHTLETDPLSHPAVFRNSRDRCYHCKKLMFTPALKLAKERTKKSLIEGSNDSDMESYRPGIKALGELNVKSPLAKAHLSKMEIFILAEELGLKNPAQPSRPCLLTRFPYDSTITMRQIAAVSKGEKLIIDMGLENFRIRVLDDGSAVLQVQESERGKLGRVDTVVRQLLAKLGFPKVSLLFCRDVSGYYDNENE